MSIDKEVEAWDEHYSSGNVMLVPDIRVIRWALNAQSTFFKGHPTHRRLKVLELGCGNGRHAVTLAKMGFPVVAFDYSRAAIDFLTTWGQIERLGRRLMAFELDLTDKKALKTFCTVMEPGSFDLVLCWGVMEYFDDKTVLRVLEEVAGMARPGSRLLIMARGERDFCYSHDERSDGFMKLHERTGEDWTLLVARQESWGGDVVIDSRIESFANIRVGGVEGEKVEHMWFIEAERL